MFESKIRAAIEEFRKGAGVSALAIDWGSLIGIIAELLLPMLLNCFGKDQAVKRMKNVNFRDGIMLRIALRKRITEDRDCAVCFGVRRHVTELMEALKKTAAGSSEEELAQVYQEALDG